LDEGRVDRQLATAEKSRHFGKVDRGVIGAAFGHVGAYVRSDEERVKAERLAEAGSGVGRGAQSQQVIDLGVGQTAARLGQSADQRLRLSAAGADEDMVTAADERQCLG